MSELETEGKASYQVPVEIYDGEALVAEFEGTFVVKK
ncbi:YiiD C-terminal domain-containing protein [Lactiplantibacillus plantarum]